VLVHGDLEIFDSTQIFEYFEDLQPNPRLWPSGRSERAMARLLELKSDEVFFPHVIRLMSLQDRLNDPLAQEAIAALHLYYEEMEHRLSQREYLNGDYSYADIAFFMAQLFAARMGAPMGTPTPALLAWRGRIARRTAVRPVIQQLIESLRQHGRPVPLFMLEAVAHHTIGS
jgi:glutathione S-transferase